MLTIFSNLRTFSGMATTQAYGPIADRDRRIHRAECRNRHRPNCILPIRLSSGRWWLPWWTNWWRHHVDDWPTRMWTFIYLINSCVQSKTTERDRSTPWVPQSLHGEEFDFSAPKTKKSRGYWKSANSHVRGFHHILTKKRKINENKKKRVIGSFCKHNTRNWYTQRI